MYRLRPIFFAAFFFSVHLALLTYLNSSMLEQFGTKAFISTIYTAAATLSLLLIIAAPSIIKQLGLARTAVITLFCSAAMLILLSANVSNSSALIFFSIYFSFNSLIGYLFDLFVEHYSIVQTTGKTRGFYLFVQNIGWVGAPVIAGIIITTYGITAMYTIAGLLVMIALIIIGTTQKSFTDRPYVRTSIKAAFQILNIRTTLRRAITINLLLQLFYAWMVVYSPIYLHHIGFNWKEIGAMLSLMLIPFVIFQYPMGRLADRIGEPRLMRIGLLIASIATLAFGIASGRSFIMYAAILFTTRVGASIIEVAVDSYFFKQVTDADTSVVGLYRSVLPVAYIIGPLAGALVLVFFSYHILFITLGIGLFIAMLYAKRITPIQSSTSDLSV